jgi:4-amino-4-deoxy-L-arabinose transferase-like glycosyltransferase
VTIGIRKFLSVSLIPRLRLLSTLVVNQSGQERSLSLTLLVVLAIAFMLPGLAAYGPWKPDEPYIFGLVDSLLKTGDWVVPTLAGEPFMEKPPLFVWMAALTAKLASPWLDVEYGARFAIGVFMLITFAATAVTARRWWGQGYGRYAVLALLASIGLQQHGRMMIPDLPLLAGFAVAFCGWAWIQERPLKGGMLLGTGLGLALMAKGLLGPGVIAISALLLPLLFRSWRTRAYLHAMLCAFVAGLPWLLVWPTALYLRDPQLFTDWFWVNNVGRFLGSSVPALGAAHESGHLFQTIPWFTFPALPLAMWALWKMRFTALASSGFQVSLVVLVVLMVVFTVSASGRVVYLLPMLIPLAIMSAPAMRLIPSRVSQWSDWMARIVFGSVAATCWVIWFCYFVADKPLLLTTLMKHLPIDLPLQFDVVGFALALLVMTGWIVVMYQLPRMKARAAVSWASGIIMVWGTAFALLLPWIDAAKSYQSMFASLSQMLGEHTRCLASVGLGESERAMLAYTTDVEPQRLEINRGGECDALLWQGVANDAPRNMDIEGWQLKWEGSRPGEHRERFWLFTRKNNPRFAENRSPLLRLPNGSNNIARAK